MTRGRSTSIILFTSLAIILCGCSEDPPSGPETPAGVTAEIVGEALHRIDFQRNLVESWLGSWQEHADRPGTNWNYEEGESAWIMTTRYHQSVHGDEAQGMAEVRRETTEKWQVVLLNNDLPVRDWSEAEIFIARWTGQCRRYALEEAGRFQTPFVYDYIGEVRAEVREGRIQIVDGAGTVDGWQSFLHDQDQVQRYRFRGDFALEILLSDDGWRCPDISLPIALAVQDEHGNQLDKYSGVLAMPAGDGHYTGRIESRYNASAWVVNARRACDD